jgi:hypothetical protein
MLFAAFPLVYEIPRGWSAGVSGLAFLGVLVGFLLGVVWYIFYENPRFVVFRTLATSNEATDNA